MKIHPDNNGIKQRDKFCPVAGASGQDKPFRGYPIPLLRMLPSLLDIRTQIYPVARA